MTNFDQNQLNEQNVQRLGIKESSNLLPKVLGDLIKHDETVLKKREELIKNKPTKGNNRAMNDYKREVPDTLTVFQFEWAVGLVLGDATLQTNTSKSKQLVRMKIQQRDFNKSLLDATLEILKPWVMTISGPSSRQMYELTTIQHEAFVPLAELLQDPTEILVQAACVRKVIPSNIVDYLSPVAIAAWFCGDGGRRDYGVNEGKAIQFHTQNFSENCVDQLVDALKQRYGWNVRKKLDGTNAKGEDYFLIQIEADSFDSFMKEITPYILPNFIKRLPKPGSERSRFRQSP
jgi:hypothetical protein